MVAVKTLVPHEVLAFLLRRSLEALRLTRGLFQMKPSYAEHPVWLRSRTSDLDVFSQIFLHREYRGLDALTDVDAVIDCGANVGYASAYFLSQFPSSSVVAVEPDAGNFATLQKNLKPYGDRARVVNSGVWSEAVGLVMNEEGFRDGREWARQVRPARAGETPAMNAVSIQSLIELCGTERISILKIDIEGA